MNTTNTRFSRVLSLSILALASSTSLVCSAADNGLTPQVKVSYADLNLSGTQGATTLYNRIRVAAQRVCYPLDGRDFASKKLMAACIDHAIATAVKDVGQPALFAVYAANNKDVSKPIVLASSQTR